MVFSAERIRESDNEVNMHCSENDGSSVQVFSCFQRSSMSYKKNIHTKKGIVITAFGSSTEQGQKAFENIHARIEEKFPDIPIRWGYTSITIRRKYREKGKDSNSLSTAISKLLDEDVTHLAVQPLHIIPGYEFEDVQRTAAAFRHIPKGFTQIVLSTPLLYSQSSLHVLGNALLQIIPENRSNDEAVLFLGHGTNHPANSFYPALAYWLQQRDPLLFVGTVEHWPDQDTILSQLRKCGAKRVYLIPLLTVAGIHAHRDIAGEDPESWKSRLENEGFECVPLLKGLVEYDNFTDLWLDQLNSALQALQT